MLDKIENKDSSYGTLSNNNNSTDTLGSSATFTGTAEANDFPDVGVSCYSDTAGTLYFDFSVNGTGDWRTFPTSGFAVAAGIHEFHTAVKLGRYFRVRFVNGSSAQSTFQLYTYFGDYRQPNAPLNQPLSLDSDAILTRPSLSGLDLSRGLVSGAEVIHKFGKADVGTSFVPVAIGGVYNTPQAASATTLRIKSGGNANDTAAGSGAREITLIGLDENFEKVTETVATAGASASSATTATFTRLYRAFVSGSGTYATASAGSHSGDIVIENGAGGTDWATISSSGFPRGQSEIGVYSVPAGKKAYIEYVAISVDSNKTADLLGFFREGADETSAPYSAMRLWIELGGVSGEEIINPTTPVGPFQGPCDIGFMAKVSSGTGEVDVDMEIIELDE